MGKKLDNDFFEIIFIYNMLTDRSYLGSIVDIVKPEYFKDKNIGKIVELTTEFFQLRGVTPTVTEIKTLLVSLECLFLQTLLLSMETTVFLI